VHLDTLRGVLIHTRTALYDNTAVAAAAAWSAVVGACTDEVLVHSARSLYPLIATVADTGDGAQARRRAGALTVLTECAAAGEPSRASLVLSCERWLLHPGRDSSTELIAEAREYAHAASSFECECAWLAGAGISTAIAEVNRNGLHDAPPSAYSLIAAACDFIVPLVWVAQRCGVSRDALRRRMRAAGHTAWRTLLPDDGAST
jgi:hypothetical protein